MQRYDDDNQMRSALDVFIFDTLSDPKQEYVGMIPLEASFAELDAAPGVRVSVKALGIEADANALPAGTTDRVTLGMHLLRDYANGVSPEKQAARLLILRAILDSLGD